MKKLITEINEKRFSKNFQIRDYEVQSNRFLLELIQIMMLFKIKTNLLNHKRGSFEVRGDPSNDIEILICLGKK